MSSSSSWPVCTTRSGVPRPSASGALESRESGFSPEDPMVGAPFLLSPAFEFDVLLNSYFRSSGFVGLSPVTQYGYARNLADFFSLLTAARGGHSWRDATEEDHVAYLVWRRRDTEGPRGAGATWSREVAAVNNFYRWAVRRGHVPERPIPQERPRGSHEYPIGSDRDVHSPATYSRESNASRSNGCRRRRTGSGAIPECRASTSMAFPDSVSRVDGRRATPCSAT